MNALLVFGTAVRRNVLTQTYEALDLPVGTDVDVVTWSEPEDDVVDLVNRLVILRTKRSHSTSTTNPATPAHDPLPAPPTGEPTAGTDAASADPAAPPGPPSTPTGPVFDGWSLARIRHGIGWRWRRVKRRLRPLQRRFRRLNWIFARHPGHVYWRHAAERPEVAMVAARADVIVAMDPVVALTCWHLARRYPEPDVVLGLTEGRRTIERRRAVV